MNSPKKARLALSKWGTDILISILRKPSFFISETEIVNLQTHSSRSLHKYHLKNKGIP